MNKRYIAAGAATVAAVGYVGSWVSASVFGISLGASPVGSSAWGDVWFAAAIIAVGLALFDSTVARCAYMVALFGGFVFMANFLSNYYGLDSSTRLYVSLGWGFYAAAIGTLVGFAAAAMSACE